MANVIRDGQGARCAATEHRSAVWNGEPTLVVAGGSTTSGAPGRDKSVANVICDGQGARCAAAEHRSGVWNGDLPSVAAEGAYEENFIPIHHSFDHRNKRGGSAGKAAEVSAQKPDLAPSAPQSTAQGGANMRKQQAKQYQRYVQ